MPGTVLCERIKQKIREEWRVKDSSFSEHSLVFDSDFSEHKMKFAILKGQVQFNLQKRLGRDSVGLSLFLALTDLVFRLMK